MPSYIEVPITIDVEDLQDQALDELQLQLPGWVPRDTHLEVILLGQLTRLVAEARAVAARVPTEIFQYFGESLLGLEPVAGAPATTTTTWTMVDTAGYTIPAGTIVAFRLAGDTLVPFEVRTEVIVPPGQGSTAAGGVIVDA